MRVDVQPAPSRTIRIIRPGFREQSTSLRDETKPRHPRASQAAWLLPDGGKEPAPCPWRFYSAPRRPHRPLCGRRSGVMLLTGHASGWPSDVQWRRDVSFARNCREQASGGERQDAVDESVSAAQVVCRVGEAIDLGAVELAGNR